MLLVACLENSTFANSKEEMLTSFSRLDLGMNEGLPPTPRYLPVL